MESGSGSLDPRVSSPSGWSIHAQRMTGQSGEEDLGIAHQSVEGRNLAGGGTQASESPWDQVLLRCCAFSMSYCTVSVTAFNTSRRLELIADQLLVVGYWKIIRTQIRKTAAIPPAGFVGEDWPNWLRSSQAANLQPRGCDLSPRT